MASGGSGETPRVSVCIITYQQAAFIGQTLDSALGQQTDFPFEICLGEDQSTDGTREICEEYAAAHPQRIRLFKRDRSLPERNRFHAPFNYNFYHTLRAARGDYIAVLDGDDYWIDPMKLRKQVDYMDSHPECAVTYHKCLVERGGRVESPFRTACREDVDLDTMIAEPHDLKPKTSAVMMRRPDFDAFEKILRESPVGDRPLIWLAGRNGCFHCMPEPMAVYRMHESGAWSGRRRVDQLRQAMMTTKNMMRFADGSVFSRQTGAAMKRHLVRCAVSFLCEPGVQRSDADQLREWLADDLDDRDWIDLGWEVRNRLIAREKTLLESTSYRLGRRITAAGERMKLTRIRRRKRKNR